MKGDGGDGGDSVQKTAGSSTYVRKIISKLFERDMVLVRDSVGYILKVNC